MSSNKRTNSRNRTTATKSKRMNTRAMKGSKGGATAALLPAVQTQEKGILLPAVQTSVPAVQNPAALLPAV